MTDKISIFAKTLNGVLFELNVHPTISSDEIFQQLVSSYPKDFSIFSKMCVNKSERLCDGDIVDILAIPEKIVSLKKMFKRENSDSLYIGVKLFDCIQNIKFYEEGDEVDVDLEHLEKIYSRFYKGTTIRGPERLGIDSNRLNITKKNSSSNEYLCSLGNYGNSVKGNDLATVLSGVFTQGIGCVGVEQEGIPFYKMEFQFKPHVVEQIVKIASDYF